MAQGELRQPRGLARINGEVIAGWRDWDWDGNAMFLADTFTCNFALNGLPASRGPDWWATQTDLEVELFAGFPADPANYGPGDLENLFSGRVDELSVQWSSGVVRLAGRDLTATFLDNKTSEKWPQQTASQIATILANRRGLTPKVTATTTKAGIFYKDGAVRLTDDRTEWDLLTWLAREEGFVVYVTGKELHFEPPPAKGSYPLKYQPAGPDTPYPVGPVLTIDTTRVLTVARDITVTVRSVNPKTKKIIVRKATRNRKGSGLVQNYTYSFPGLDPAGAQKKANQILADLSRHEMRLNFRGPADNALKKSDLITLSGTGTAFDQTYFPDSIRRSISFDGGYVMQVAAKNHNPESQPDL
jgi:phage protein D